MTNNKPNVVVINGSNKQLTLLNRVITSSTKPQEFWVPNPAYFKQMICASGCEPISVKTLIKPKVAPKESDSKQELILVSELELSTSVEKNLIASDCKTIKQLTEMTEENVIAVKGIAAAGLDEIKQALEKNGRALLVEDK